MNVANPFAAPPPPVADPLAGLELSQQQAEAFAKVQAWLQQSGPKSSQIFRLFGYAGTGKTTLARILAAQSKGRVCFGAFTGKAASVLQQKGCEGAATLHSLIYKPVTDHDGQITWIQNEQSVLRGASLLIVDEVSMVGPALGKALVAFGCKILVLGDPGQLPPVEGTGFFTRNRPDVLLTEIHRQDKGSEIVQLAHQVRGKQRLSVAASSENSGNARVIAARSLDIDTILSADQILVGKNDTRRRFNTRIRELRGCRGPEPEVGDKVVCLKNDRGRGLYNGDVWHVAEIHAARHPDRIRLVLEPANAVSTKRVSVSAHRELLLGGKDVGSLSAEERKLADMFEYGYALTVHKAQGSQWDTVVLFDESSAFGDDASRWLYTGLTRAAKAITVVQP